jgi:hypothetical protein
MEVIRLTGKVVVYLWANADDANKRADTARRVVKLFILSMAGL